ncbi:hypothetical protein H2203_005492 [Taxawa tesnikishii (nom. ined.)]|nr:hypothetical protein H2203_005492 [Dothideales sp. JES 119]
MNQTVPWAYQTLATVPRMQLINLQTQPHSFPGRKNLPKNLTTQKNNVPTPVSQLAALLKSYESQITSLQQAHGREVSTLQTYINLLEHHHSTGLSEAPSKDEAHTICARINGDTNRTLAARSQTHLTIDTSQVSAKVGELLVTDDSDTTLLSLDTASECQKRTSQENVAEIKTLKQRLDVSRQLEATAKDMEKERDDLRNSLKISERRIKQLEESLSRSNDNEMTLRNTAEHLEARLDAANNQRLDVLQGYHEAREKARRLYEQEGMLMHELEQLRRRPTEAEANELRTRLHAAEDEIQSLKQQTNLAHDRAGFAPLVASLQERVQQAHDNNDAKSSRIAELERENEALRFYSSPAPQFTPPSDHQEPVELDASPGTERKTVMKSTEEAAKHTVKELECHLEHQKAVIISLQAERNTLSSLLRAEVRRQARTSAKQGSSIPTPAKAKRDIDASVTELRTRIAAAVSATPAESDKPGEELWNLKMASLETELERLAEEVVLYKLDVRGYRKDLKNAHATIEDLQHRLPPADTSASKEPEKVGGDEPAPSPRQSPRVEDVLAASYASSTWPERARQQHTAVLNGLGITLGSSGASFAGTTASSVPSTTLSDIEARRPKPRSERTSDCRNRRTREHQIRLL